MPRQEGKTPRKSQGRAVDGAWEEKKGRDAPPGRKTSRKSQGRAVDGVWEEKKDWDAPSALTLTFHIGVV